MMIMGGEFTIPGNKMPPNSAEAEASYAIFCDLITHGWLTCRSEPVEDGKDRGKTLIEWVIKEPE